MERINPGLNWINLGILGTAALIPFPTGVLAEALQAGNVEVQRSAVVLYGALAGLMSAAWIPVFPYLERHREFLAPSVPEGFFARQKSRPWVGVASYIGAIAAALFLTPWLKMAVLVLILFHHAITSEGLESFDEGN